jgi:hypothetical protein
VDRMIDEQDVGPGEILGRGAMISPRTSKVSKTRGTSPSRRVLHSTILRKYSGVYALEPRLTFQRDLWERRI